MAAPEEATVRSYPAETHLQKAMCECRRILATPSRTLSDEIARTRCPKQEYHRLFRLVHPDRHSGASQAEIYLLNEAFAALSNCYQSRRSENETSDSEVSSENEHENETSDSEVSSENGTSNSETDSHSFADNIDGVLSSKEFRDLLMRAMAGRGPQ